MAPDTFPAEFDISVKPVTNFANGTKVVGENPNTTHGTWLLHVSSLKLFDIG